MPEMDVNCCVVCGEKHSGTKMMMRHLIRHLVTDGFVGSLPAKVLRCWCGLECYYKIGHEDDAIGWMRSHMSGRPGAAVTEANVTMEEIHRHFHQAIWGIKP